ncbi:hypothetical protein CR513_03828, partial [Mucuna pruriens]
MTKCMTIQQRGSSDTILDGIKRAISRIKKGSKYDRVSNKEEEDTKIQKNKFAHTMTSLNT